MDMSTTNSTDSSQHDEKSTSMFDSSLLFSTTIETTKNSPVTTLTDDYLTMSDEFLTIFSRWDDREQLLFVEQLLKRMHSHQHAQINMLLLPMLQRDFIGQLAARGLEHIAEKILGYLDDQSLMATELVCQDWYHVVSEGMTNYTCQ
jgi:F-box and WD-40 domain protein 1/11